MNLFSHLMAKNSTLLKEVITIIPNDEKIFILIEIIFAVEGNSQLEFNVANLRATGRNFRLQKA